MILRSSSALACLLLALWGGSALAHDRSTSFSTWRIDENEAQVTVRVAAIELSRLPWAATGATGGEPELAEYLTGHLRLYAGERACPVSEPPLPLASEPGRVALEWRLRCEALRPLEIRSDLLRAEAPGHLHFARIVMGEALPLERVLSAREPSWRLEGSGSADELAGTTLGGYVALGIEHILGGADHLAFLLALLLLGGSIGQVAKVVTGFTLAHSSTLALAVLGVVRPDRGPIEALIGLSIVLVAIENVWWVGGRGRVLPHVVAGTLVLLALAALAGYGQVPALTLAGLGLFALCYFGLLEEAGDARSLRFAVAFLFGLVHGFGFAAVLTEAELPRERLALALFGFNCGVELGQLGVVAVLWPILTILLRAEGPRAVIVEVASALVLSLGVYWFVARAYF